MRFGIDVAVYVLEKKAGEMSLKNSIWRKVIVSTLGLLSLGAIAELTAPLSTRYENESLKTRFASWGILPKYGAANINVKDSWVNFKKNSNVVVAVVDTGIQFNHKFLKNMINYNIHNT